MQTPVEIRYAGVVLGRSDSVRSDDADAAHLFVTFPEPLPVGTRLELVAPDGAHAVRVERVVEATGQSPPGMKVSLQGAIEARAGKPVAPSAAQASPAADPAALAAATPDAAPPTAAAPPLATAAAPAETGDVPQATDGPDSSRSIEVTEASGEAEAEPGESNGAGETNGSSKKKKRRRR